jgi:hypothetical protein
MNNVGSFYLCVSCLIVASCCNVHSALAEETARTSGTFAQEIDAVETALNAFHGTTRTVHGAKFRVVTPDSIFADSKSGPIVEVRRPDGHARYVAPQSDGSVKHLKKDIRRVWWTNKARGLVEGLPYSAITAMWQDEAAPYRFILQPTDFVPWFMAVLAIQPLEVVRPLQELDFAIPESPLQSPAEKQSLLRRASACFPQQNLTRNTYAFGTWRNAKDVAIDVVVIVNPTAGIVYSIRLPASDEPQVICETVTSMDSRINSCLLFEIVRSLTESVTSVFGL